MAQVIEDRRPGTVIVNERDDEPRSNSGVIIAAIALLIILLILIFGVRPMGGGSTKTINVQTPTTTTPTSGTH